MSGILSLIERLQNTLFFTGCLSLSAYFFAPSTAWLHIHMSLSKILILTFHILEGITAFFLNLMVAALALQLTFFMMLKNKLKPYYYTLSSALCSVGEPGEEWAQGLGSGAGVWWAGSCDGKSGLLNQFSRGMFCDPTLLKSDMAFKGDPTKKKKVSVPAGKKTLRCLHFCESRVQKKKKLAMLY